MTDSISSSQGTTFRVHGVRYQTRNVSRAVAFYTNMFGFTLKHQQGEAFAAVSLGGTDLLLSGAESSGARPLPGGERQQPGGWNRLVLAVDHLADVVTDLREKSVELRHDIITGPGGSQVQILDPDGNPIELFEPAPRS
jgi:glyoxylase I family protein